MTKKFKMAVWRGKNSPKWPFSAFSPYLESDLRDGSWDHYETLGQVRVYDWADAHFFGMTKNFKMAAWWMKISQKIGGWHQTTPTDLLQYAHDC